MSSDAADPNDFMARYHRERAAAETRARADLRYVAGVLRLLGVATVTAAFDGSGDEGFVEDVTYDPDPPAGLPDGLRDVIDDAVCDLLPGGWEINAGSFGTVTIDTATGEPDVDHEWRDDEDEMFDAEGE